MTHPNFAAHNRRKIWYKSSDLIREEGITLMRGDVLVFVARSDSRHILFEDGEPMTHSEFKFFGSPRTFEHNVLRKIKPKEI